MKGEKFKKFFQIPHHWEKINIEDFPKFLIRRENQDFFQVPH